MKNSQLHYDLSQILAILPTLGSIILTKFDEEKTKIVDYLLVIYFLVSVIFHESVYSSPYKWYQQD